jgi:group I intron endonuclease
LVLGDRGYFYNALRKYGRDSFVWEVLQECSSIDELNDAEIRLIQEYGANDRSSGYNINDGGKNARHTEETKRILSEKRKGFRFSKESKNKMSDSKKGSLNFMYGKHWSSAIRKKQSDSRTDKKPVYQIDAYTGSIISEFASIADAQRLTGINNISSTCSGKYKKHGGFIWMYKSDYDLLTDEERSHLPELHKPKTTKGKSNLNGANALREFYKKNTHHAKGKKMVDILGEGGLESWKKKCAEAKYKPVIQIDKLTEKEIARYPSLKSASSKTGIQPMSISNACHGKTKTAGGYKWRYAE